jgi:hypothetical protein
MTDRAMVPNPVRPGGTLRTPRAAAVAGVVFSVLLIFALVVLRLSVPIRPAVPGAWLTNSGRRTAVAIALNLIPFAGIAFLWFVGVVRDRIGDREDRFFATVFLGSGLLFVAMLMVGAAVAGGFLSGLGLSGPAGASSLPFGRRISVILLNVFSMRMAAVFTLSTVTIARHTHLVSRLLTIAGLVIALVLLVSAGRLAWVELLFPAWILAVSLEILIRGRSAPAASPVDAK